MASRSRPARESALEIGNDLHSSVKIHDPACQPKISAATANVPIAETRAAIFRNVAITTVIPGLAKRSILPPDSQVPIMGNKVSILCVLRVHFAGLIAAVI